MYILKIDMPKIALIVGCLAAALTTSAQAGPNVVGTFVADVGKSRVTSSMHGCGKSTAKPFGHKITLFDNGTFQEDIDLNGDDIADSVTSGLWAEPRDGDIAMIYDGDIAQGAGGSGAWATLINEAQGSLRQKCEDNSVSLLPATIMVKKLSIKLNKQRNQAEYVSSIEAYAQGGFTGTGKVALTAKAKGQYQLP